MRSPHARRTGGQLPIRSSRSASSFDWLLRTLALGGGVLLSAHGSLPGQWTQASPSAAPSARTDAAIAYDVGRRMTVLFGGFPGNAETHGWDGATWRLLANSGPPAMWASALASDPGGNGLVLFGGKTASIALNETWLWNGALWTRVFPASSPSVRYFHAMAYDPIRARTVLFGGQTTVPTYLGDTWEWNGTNWAQRASTGPTPRSGHKMAWDPRRGAVLLFGGTDAAGPSGETWSWNGSTWALVASGGPAADPRPSLATVGANVALFDSGSSSRPTWTWDGTNWTQLSSPADPTNRTGAAMAADVNGAVLFGGYNIILGHLADTWTLRVANTRLTVPASAINVEGNAFVPLGSATRRRMQTVIAAAAFPANQRTGLLHGVHLRRDAGPNLFLGRTLDLRVTLGAAATSPTGMSTSFLANWAGTPTLVFQGNVSLPVELPVQPGPAPFNVVLPFGTSFVWNAQTLALEFEVVGTNLPAQYDLDAVTQPYTAGVVTGAGQSCAGSSGTPSMVLPGAAGLVIGGAIDIGLASALPGAIAFSFLGDNDTQWLGIPLPFTWPGTNCRVYHNWVVNQPALVTGGGSARAVYPIPAQTYLSGTRLFSQWGIYEGAGSTPLVTTSMARMTIGPFPPVYWDTISNADGSATGVKAAGAWSTPVLQLDLN